MRLLLFAFLIPVISAGRDSQTQSESADTIDCFKKGHEFRYHVDTQVSSNLLFSSTHQSAVRIQSTIILSFPDSDTEALFALESIRLASSHKEIPHEQFNLSEENLRLLRLPVSFIYEDGLVSDIEFDSTDIPWSKQMKKSVINMFQVNMARKRSAETLFTIQLESQQKIASINPEVGNERKCEHPFRSLLPLASSPTEQTNAQCAVDTVIEHFSRPTPANAISEEANNLDEDALIDLINSSQKLWVAGHTDFEHYAEFFPNMTGYIDVPPLPQKSTSSGYRYLPDFFDARLEWTKCKTISMIPDQSTCGNCNAVAVSGSFSDRLCVHSFGRKLSSIPISTMDVTECDTTSQGCEGGIIQNTWKFLKDVGAVTGGPYNSKKGCKPYGYHPCGLRCRKQKYPKLTCVRKCIPQYNITYEDDKYTAHYVYNLPPNDVTAIMRDIFDFGSVVASFQVYKDFFNYNNGTYIHVKGAYVGQHATRIIGWGEEKGTPYWITTSNWGEDFGEKGIIKIRRGTNEVGIEADVSACSFYP